MPISAEYVTINSVVLSLDGAWEIADPTILLADAPGRGENLTVSDAAGTVFRSKERGEWRDVLELDVYGLKNHLGAAHADERSGVRLNVRYLNAQLLAANVGLVALTYTFPDATVLQANVEVRTIVASAANQLGNIVRCGLEVVIPDGRLTVAP